MYQNESMIRQLIDCIGVHLCISLVDLSRHLQLSELELTLLLEEAVSLGLPVLVQQKTVRLKVPVQWLSQEHIAAAMPPCFELCSVHFQLGSTNEWLRARIMQGALKPQLCLAEHQTAGRGRRGRDWLSAMASGVLMSLSWPLSSSATGLSLCIGMAVVDGLERIGVQGAQLKWPNDIVFDGCKVGGLLCEVISVTSGGPMVIVGLGLNVTQTPSDLGASAWPAGSLQAHGALDRNQLCIELAHQMARACTSFQEGGCQDLPLRWRRYDCLRDREVLLNGTFAGYARGVDSCGNLLIQQPNNMMKAVNSGEVTVRPASVGTCL